MRYETDMSRERGREGELQARRATRGVAQDHGGPRKSVDRLVGVARIVELCVIV